MFNASRCHLYTYRALYRTRYDLAMGYQLINTLDAICLSETVVWANDRIRGGKPDYDIICNLLIDSGVLMARANMGKFVTVLPVIEAGYNLEYNFHDGRLSSMVWFTPKGKITLEFGNAGNQSPKAPRRGGFDIGRRKTGL